MKEVDFNQAEYSLDGLTRTDLPEPVSEMVEFRKRSIVKRIITNKNRSMGRPHFKEEKVKVTKQKGGVENNPPPNFPKYENEEWQLPLDIPNSGTDDS